jgi:hypothetical protein
MYKPLLLEYHFQIHRVEADCSLYSLQGIPILVIHPNQDPDFSDPDFSDPDLGDELKESDN